jgi:hypothetical protein
MNEYLNVFKYLYFMKTFIVYLRMRHSPILMHNMYYYYYYYYYYYF